MKEVREIFRGTYDDEVIESVLESCNCDAERATTLLCELTPDIPLSNGEQDTARQHAGNARSERNTEEYSGPCLWDALATECQLQVALTPFRHAECQSLATSSNMSHPWHCIRPLGKQVWENLSLKDMARAAGTCKAFAAHARETRSELRTLKPPPGVLFHLGSCLQGG